MKLKGFIIFVLLLVSTTSYSANQIFVGDNYERDNKGIAFYGYVIACKYTATSTGSADHLSFYLTSPDCWLRLGIYDGTTATPVNLLAESGVYQAISGWNSLTITATDITAGVNYWLAFRFSFGASGTRYSRYVTGDINQSTVAVFQDNFNAFPNPFGEVGSTAGRETSINASNYTITTSSGRPQDQSWFNLLFGSFGF